jgi:hypothetical protein
LFFSIGLFQWACSKEKNTSFSEDLMATQRSNLPDVVDLLELLKQPVDGYAYVSSQTSYSSQDYATSSIMIGGYAYDKQGVKRDVGNLSFDNFVLQPSSTFDYFQSDVIGSADLFGKSINVSLQGKNAYPGFSSNMYAPKLVRFTTPSYSNQMPISSDTNIGWNADSQNSVGIGIIISFDPLSVGNITKGFRDHAPQTRFVHTEDDGAYTLTQADLAGIPVGALANITFGRANYSKVSMADNFNFGIISYSINTLVFTRQ